MTLVEALKQIIDLADIGVDAVEDPTTYRRIIEVAETALEAEREKVRNRVARSRSRSSEEAAS